MSSTTAGKPIHDCDSDDDEYYAMNDGTNSSPQHNRAQKVNISTTPNNPHSINKVLRPRNLLQPQLLSSSRSSTLHNKSPANKTEGGVANNNNKGCFFGFSQSSLKGHITHKSSSSSSSSSPLNATNKQQHQQQSHHQSKRNGPFYTFLMNRIYNFCLSRSELLRHHAGDAPSFGKTRIVLMPMIAAIFYSVALYAFIYYASVVGIGSTTTLIFFITVIVTCFVWLQSDRAQELWEKHWASVPIFDSQPLIVDTDNICTGSLDQALDKECRLLQDSTKLESVAESDAIGETLSSITAATITTTTEEDINDKNVGGDDNVIISDSPQDELPVIVPNDVIFQSRDITSETPPSPSDQVQDGDDLDKPEQDSNNTSRHSDDESDSDNNDREKRLDDLTSLLIRPAFKSTSSAITQQSMIQNGHQYNLGIKSPTQQQQQGHGRPATTTKTKNGQIIPSFIFKPRKPESIETIRLFKNDYLQTAFDICNVGFLYCTPFIGGIFIALPILAALIWGVTHWSTIVILTAQLFYYLSYTGDLHLSGDGASRWLRHASHQLWQSVFRYFSVHVLSYEWEEMHVARDHCIDSIQIIRRIQLPPHILNVLAADTTTLASQQEQHTIDPMKFISTHSHNNEKSDTTTSSSSSSNQPIFSSSPPSSKTSSQSSPLSSSSSSNTPMKLSRVSSQIHQVLPPSSPSKSPLSPDFLSSPGRSEPNTPNSPYSPRSPLASSQSPQSGNAPQLKINQLENPSSEYSGRLSSHNGAQLHISPSLMRKEEGHHHHHHHHHGDNTHEHEVVINLDEIMTHEELGLDIPYLYYQIGPQRFKYLQQLKQTNPEYQPTYEDLTFSHPQLIISNKNVTLNQLPPISLINYIQSNTHAWIPTMATSFTFTQSPHGIYPLSAFFSHKSPQFKQLFGTRVKRTFEENFDDLQFRAQEYPDFFGKLQPLYNRYECLPFYEPTELQLERARKERMFLLQQNGHENEKDNNDTKTDDEQQQQQQQAHNNGQVEEEKEDVNIDERKVDTNTSTPQQQRQISRTSSTNSGLLDFELVETPSEDNDKKKEQDKYGPDNNNNNNNNNNSNITPSPPSSESNHNDIHQLPYLPVITSDDEQFHPLQLTENNIHHYERSFLPKVLKSMQQKYPRHATRISSPTDVDVLGASVLSFTPGLREVFLMNGGADVSRNSLLLRVTTNRSVLLIPGGQQEMVYSSHKDFNYHFHTGHLGFIKLALRTGSPLVPIISFGENQLLSTWQWRSVQMALYRWTRVFLPLYPHGPAFSPVPHSSPITLAIGEPIFVPCYDSDDIPDEVVRYYHSVYLNHVARLFFDSRESIPFAKNATLTFF